MQDSEKSDAASRRFRTLAVAAAKAADAKKGEDLLLLNIHRFTSLTDYLLLVSADSPPHIKALQDHVEEVLEEKGAVPVHRDGRESGTWRVLDYGGLMIHFLNPETRRLFALERLFHGARRIAVP